jgi:hypothetical protein
MTVSAGAPAIRKAGKSRKRTRLHLVELLGGLPSRVWRCPKHAGALYFGRRAALDEQEEM